MPQKKRKQVKKSATKLKKAKKRTTRVKVVRKPVRRTGVRKAQKASKKKITSKKTRTKKTRPARAKTRPASRRTSVKRAAPRVSKGPVPIGAVTHYFGNIGVAIVKFAKPIEVGARLRFMGATTDFTDIVMSMQYEREQIMVAKKGLEVGIKVKDRVREGDQVYEA